MHNNCIMHQDLVKELGMYHQNKNKKERKKGEKKRRK